MSPYGQRLHGLIVAPCEESTIHLQTSMLSPRFEQRPYDTAVYVANHYTRWGTLNSRRATICLVRLVSGEGTGEVPDHTPQEAFPQN
ncbi:hypothetical protein TNCV_4548281 [Trichonephila clavipes]|nr:hypothetical protein TNCV_4548281 [Trichonephila clavipes]